MISGVLFVCSINKIELRAEMTFAMKIHLKENVLHSRAHVQDLKT